MSQRYSPAVRLADPTVRQVVLRLLVFAGCLVLAFWRTGLHLADESRADSLVAYVYPLLLLALLGGQGIARRRPHMLPIHDRQADHIVAGMALIAAMAVMGLLVPRYHDRYQLLHLDCAAELVFAIGAAMLLFGLRPIGSFWPVYVFVAAFNPFIFRLETIVLGGQPYDGGVVMVLASSAATAIAVGRTSRRAVLGAIFALAVGLALLTMLTALVPHPPLVVLLTVPSLTAGMGVSVAFLFHRHGGWPLRLLDRDEIEPLSAKSARNSMIALAVASVAFFLLPLPPSSAQLIAPAPPNLRAATPLTLPPGWLTTRTEDAGDVQRLFGQGAALIRQRVVAIHGDYHWDLQGRPRIVSIDLMSTPHRHTIEVYPEGSLYRTVGTRRSPDLSVDLGRQVVGRLYTVVDENLLLTYTKLTFTWANPTMVQQVTMLTVDDHRPTGEFPKPGFSLADYLADTFSVLIRGNAISSDENPTYKDRDFLTQLGRRIVDAQFGGVL